MSLIGVDREHFPTLVSALLSPRPFPNGTSVSLLQEGGTDLPDFC